MFPVKRDSLKLPHIQDELYGWQRGGHKMDQPAAAAEQILLIAVKAHSLGNRAFDWNLRTHRPTSHARPIIFTDEFS